MERDEEIGEGETISRNPKKKGRKEATNDMGVTLRLGEVRKKKKKKKGEEGERISKGKVILHREGTYCMALGQGSTQTQHNGFGQ